MIRPRAGSLKSKDGVYLVLIYYLISVAPNYTVSTNKTVYSVLFRTFRGSLMITHAEIIFTLR